MEAPDTLLAAFAVPSVMLGAPPEPRSHYERGAHLVIQAEAFGDVMLVLDDPDALAYHTARIRRNLGIQ